MVPARVHENDAMYVVQCTMQQCCLWCTYSFFSAIPTSNHFTFLDVVKQYHRDVVVDFVTGCGGFHSWMLWVWNWGNEGKIYKDHSLYAVPVDMLTQKVCKGYDINERYLIHFKSTQPMR